MKQYTDFNTLLYDAKLVKKIQKKNAIYFPHWDRPTYNWSSSSGCMAPISTNASENVRGNGATKDFSGWQGSYNNSVATKPAGWTGQWHKLQANPSKLTDTDCETLLKQECCSSCRGLGYYKGDFIYSNKKNRDADGKKRLNITHEGHVSLEELGKE